ncbi:MAG TPA: DUF3667 domain-containing protein [Thermoanaerobaculia bacterium]|nr:DUF3667 domain-containing protein [Thermoanaerobaculia bacterium]
MSESTICTNCHDPRAATYCANCGEQQPSHHDLTVKHLLHELLHEMLHVDGKLWRTLKELIVHPGQLTVEYFAGQKKRSIGPLRLFLTLFALQFVAYTAYKPAAIYSVATFRKFDTNGALGSMLDRKAAKHHMTREAYDDKIDERWHKNLSMLQLANIVGIAIVLKLIYLRRKRAFAEHLVFAAHYLTFSYLFTLLIWPFYAANGFTPGPLQRTLTLTHIGVNLIYLFFAQRRFYGQSSGKAALKTALAWAGTYAVAVTIMAGALVAAMLQYR